MRPVLILGGGPAGAVAAIHLARTGRSVTVIERSVGQVDKVCGDFLSGEAMAALQGLGLDPAALAPAPIRRLRLLHRDRGVEAMLPFPAAGLSRRTLDAALLDLASACGARIERGRTVRGVGIGRQGLSVRMDGGDERTAETVFLATGKHDLRDLPRPGRGQGSVGLKMYFRLTPTQGAALADAVELVLFRGGYAGLQHVDGGRTVLCLAIAQARLREAGPAWTSVLDLLRRECPHLGARLTGATELLARPLAIAGTPYGFLTRADADAPDGLFRLGDQAAVIPSLTGDGIAIALHSARLAVAMLNRHGNCAADYHRRLRADLLWQMRRAGALQAACQWPALQRRAVMLSGRWPGLLRLAARQTRLRASEYRDVQQSAPGWRPSLLQMNLDAD